MLPVEDRWLDAAAAAEVIRCEVALKDAGLRFGQVASAHLVLRAALVGCKFRPTDQFDKLQEILVPSVRCASSQHWTLVDTITEEPGNAVVEDRELPAWADIDVEADALPLVERAWLVPILQDKSNLAMAGLVVVKIESNDSSGAQKGNVYRRIGKFYSYDWEGSLQVDKPVPLVDVVLV